LVALDVVVLAHRRAASLSSSCRLLTREDLDLLGHSGRFLVRRVAIMADPDRAIAILRELRAMGVRLSVDDFGTGHSSMSYLKILPVDELKVDRSFVSDMTRDVNDAVLVQSAIDLGHNLGLSVVAEGVEDAATLGALKTLGADIIQGCYLGRPMSEDLLKQWVIDRADRLGENAPAHPASH
jgi:EAL domain-containing protein (putative c-di-GMP-specific phosphodiesterase class I)